MNIVLWHLALNDIHNPTPDGPTSSKSFHVLRISAGLKFSFPRNTDRQRRLPTCVDKIRQVQDRKYAQPDEKPHGEIVVCVNFEVLG